MTGPPGGTSSRREPAILIPTVEDGLESYLRSALPLTPETGDISFEAPSSTWAAQVNRITVSLFLYNVARSPVPPRPAASRPGPDGRAEHRAPLPMVQLSYLVSAWAGSTRDEHQLLGDVLTRLVAQQVLPVEHLAVPLESSVQLSLAVDELNRPRELWSGLGGTLKASFTLLATVAADAYPWQLTAPAVTSVEATATPLRPAVLDRRA
ncbi:hypothetical protein CELL_01649 [Cellulomonas sp. T2.31MG-18]|uniref:DUF4255 domain-containing protein n=1 Tax=Cellulomonas sp. T2.31MG-18 TaxID=3157619 RepID=UPI0035E6E960